MAENKILQQGLWSPVDTHLLFGWRPNLLGNLKKGRVGKFIKKGLSKDSGLESQKPQVEAGRAGDNDKTR